MPYGIKDRWKITRIVEPGLTLSKLLQENTLLLMYFNIKSKILLANTASRNVVGKKFLYREHMIICVPCMFHQFFVKHIKGVTKAFQCQSLSSEIETAWETRRGY